jgi:hypothetical protein
MVLEGHVRNGTIVLDSAVELPEGTPVEVHVASPDAQAAIPAVPASIWAAFAEVAAGIPPDALKHLPEDSAQRHDAHISPTEEGGA